MTAAETAVTLTQQLKAYDEAIAELAPVYETADRLLDYRHADEMAANVSADYIEPFAEQVRVTTHPALWNIEALQSEDEAKRDLELTCTTCREHLCDVEPSDIFAVLMSTALEHIRERHLSPESEEDHR